MIDQSSVKRGRGRPQIRSDEETQALIGEAARIQFNDVGYALASMTTIARQAGISTKTLYRLFPAKSDLFERVVSDKIETFFSPQPETGENESVAEGLERLLISYGRLALSRDTVLTTRLVLGESDRFPEIAQVFFEKAVLRTTALIAEWLMKQTTAGFLVIDDPIEAAGMLRGMMAMEPQRAVMLRKAACPSDEEIRARARKCALYFVDGCRYPTGKAGQIE